MIFKLNISVYLICDEDHTKQLVMNINAFTISHYSIGETHQLHNHVYFKKLFCIFHEGFSTIFTYAQGRTYKS